MRGFNQFENINFTWPINKISKSGQNREGRFRWRRHSLCRRRSETICRNSPKCLVKKWCCGHGRSTFAFPRSTATSLSRKDWHKKQGGRVKEGCLHVGRSHKYLDIWPPSTGLGNIVVPRLHESLLFIHKFGVKSNPLIGTLDNSSIRLLVQVFVSPILVKYAG